MLAHVEEYLSQLALIQMKMADKVSAVLKAGRLIQRNIGSFSFHDAVECPIIGL